MFGISIDERLVSKHPTKDEAWEAFKKLKLSKFDQGYLDKIDEHGEPIYTVAHKIGRKIFVND